MHHVIAMRSAVLHTMTERYRVKHDPCLSELGLSQSLRKAGDALVLGHSGAKCQQCRPEPCCTRPLYSRREISRCLHGGCWTQQAMAATGTLLSESLITVRPSLPRFDWLDGFS
ncbi:hypothetical protein RRG08_036588 [Elysia crispata]|uniref:Uncharacterized protein n=1 Tax=Elysia crispata TaxID=231223 RepID=A0AAE0ZRC1_9GAST|nr:hypothetical protein RRG08_036588 [Elysia crispata]